MKIIEQIKIKNNSDLIYAKTILRKILEKKEVLEDTFLIFALMELSTNLIKHANGGEIWILEKDSQILLAALDKGPGIKNLKWAMQKGTTQMENSLGLGLHQISNNEYYKTEIATFTDKDLHGTAVLVMPNNLDMGIVSFQIPYIREKVSGDLIAKKGKFLLIADISGHGKKAYKSVEFIKSYFYNTLFSCVLIDEFFEDLHNKLKANELRGAVLSVFEITNKFVQVCGVGNISLWVKESDKYINFSQKDGILGEAFSSSDKKVFEFDKNTQVIAATDGIEIIKMNKLLSLLAKNISSIMIAVCSIYYASLEYDDKSILIITKGEKNE
jgi:hypothetical protein